MRIEAVTPHPTFSHFGHVTLVVKDVSNDELKVLQEIEGTPSDIVIISEKLLQALRKKLEDADDRS